MDTTPIERAVSAAGGQTALARILTTPERRVLQGHVWAWLNRDKKLPAEFVLATEAATGVSRYELRPDVFGQPGPDGGAEAA